MKLTTSWFGSSITWFESCQHVKSLTKVCLSLSKGRKFLSCIHLVSQYWCIEIIFLILMLKYKCKNIHGVNLPNLVFEQTVWKHGHHKGRPFSENQGKSVTESVYNKEKVLRMVERTLYYLEILLQRRNHLYTCQLFRERGK